ncbi:hypothetical protein NliqN6_1017 [Naganishia liquefaciens]|uniref:Zn(2)-C6 fungal-type domain-containing protein n=1 Tax=Naganishia liquefaciens TaxID=104408 RepID=A0A8H3TQA1_9TREE|nr:hypothetical protein NliqN6_1017 [Naganishia liquefaciens]
MKVPPFKHTSAMIVAAGSSPTGTSNAFDSAGNPFEHRVARAISACTRCRSRKSKCDGKLPACSACEKAKVECVGFDAISKKNVSRSYIHELEQEVVALRSQLDSYRSHGAPVESSSASMMNLEHQDPALLEDAQMLTNLATAAASHQAMHHQQSRPHQQQQEYQHPPSVSPGSLHQFPQPYPPAQHSMGISSSRAPPSLQREYSDTRMDSRSGPLYQQSSFDRGYGGQTGHQRSASNAPSRTATVSDSRGSMYNDDPTLHPTAREMVDSVVSDIAFGGAIAASDLPRPVGHFMGASSGVSLARLVVDAVLRIGPAAGPPLPERRDSVLEPAMSRPNASPTAGHAVPRPEDRRTHGAGTGGGSNAVDSEQIKSETPAHPPSDTSPIDPALSSFNTRTDYPTSHSRLPQGVPQSMPPPLAPAASPYTSNQRTSLESPSPKAQPNRPTGAPPPMNIPALPPPAAVDRLVQVYVDFVQIMLPILHMPTFERQLQRVRERSADIQESDIFFVLMVLALSTMALSRSLDPTAELRMSSEAFYVEASKHLEAVFEDRSYVGLQAILLCCYYSLLNPTRGSIWHLVGLASRCAVDHGFHHETEAAKNLSPLEIDMRRRLFHAVYNLDRLLCHSLGRPHSIPDDFIAVPPFSDLPDSAITDQGLLSAEPDPYKVVALNFIPLRELQSEINSRLYSVKAVEQPSQEWFDSMFERLKVWLSNSPEPKGCTSAEGYAISFHNTVLLLFRPSPACPRPSKDALAACLSSSSYIIRIFRTIQRKNKINWMWLSSHYVFMAGITYLYGLWNMNMLGDSPVTMMDAHLDVQACLGTLEALSVSVPSARACRSTFEMLSTAIIRRLSGEQTEASLSATRNDRDGFLSVAGLGSAGARAESAMRHSFQSQGLPSPLPKMELPTELHLLDNLFLNPLVPHPKASESTMVKTGFPNPEYFNQGDAAPYSLEGRSALSDATALTPGALNAGETATPQNYSGSTFNGEADGAAPGFDFLSFLAADDGSREANAQWLSTEPYRQDMPMLG